MCLLRPLSPLRFVDSFFSLLYFLLGLDDWYWQTLQGLDLVDGDNYALLYVLAYDVGVLGVFSDWPATTTFFANCMGLSLHKG
jgi:hypothetical protein